MKSIEEIVVLEEYLKENMSKQFICQFSSAFAALVLLAKTTDSGLYTDIEYWNILVKTTMNWYPLILIQMIPNLLLDSKTCSKLDYRSTYTQLYNLKGDLHNI